MSHNFAAKRPTCVCLDTGSGFLLTSLHGRPRMRVELILASNCGRVSAVDSLGRRCTKPDCRPWSQQALSAEHVLCDTYLRRPLPDSSIMTPINLRRHFRVFWRPNGLLGGAKSQASRSWSSLRRQPDGDAGGLGRAVQPHDLIRTASSTLNMRPRSCGAKLNSGPVHGPC